MSEDWIPKLKHYPHFDAPIPEKKILDIVTNENQVKENTFFPFLYYWDIRQKFGRQPAKERKIRYAARRDSYIYAYYRWLLSKPYEKKLLELGLQECVIAYRKVPIGNGRIGNKSNIYFAHDVFSEIRHRKNCIAVALDISKYFEMINHAKLEQIWCELLEAHELPPHHKTVFRHITQYAEVSFDKVCEILGFKGEVLINGEKKFGFKREISNKLFFTAKEYKQICTPADFRKKIVPAKIIEKNKHPYGIPQGSPISDILANMNLLFFDKTMKKFCDENDIYYRRYSDDILFVLPTNHELLNSLMIEVRKNLFSSGEQLEIKDSKTIIRQFSENGNYQDCIELKNGISIKAPFDYLGFRYDGKIVTIKDGTLHNYFRKITYGMRQEANWLVSRNKGKSADEIIKLANFGVIYKKYGTIEDYRKIDFSLPGSKRKLTFIAYAQRALSVFRDFDNRILKQIAAHKSRIRKRLIGEIEGAVLRKQKKTQTTI